MVTRLRNGGDFTYDEADAMPGDGFVDGEPPRAKVDFSARSRTKGTRRT
jgi:hypothetical protein